MNGKYHCDQCDDTFVLERSLNIHIGFKHKRENSFGVPSAGLEELGVCSAKIKKKSAWVNKVNKQVVVEAGGTVRKTNFGSKEGHIIQLLIYIPYVHFLFFICAFIGRGFTFYFFNVILY